MEAQPLHGFGRERAGVTLGPQQHPWGDTEEAEPPPGLCPGAPHRRLGVPARQSAGAGDKRAASFQGLLHHKHCGILTTGMFSSTSAEELPRKPVNLRTMDTARPWGARLGPEAETESGRPACSSPRPAGPATRARSPASSRPLACLGQRPEHQGEVLPACSQTSHCVPIIKDTCPPSGGRVT